MSSENRFVAIRRVSLGIAAFATCLMAVEPAWGQVRGKRPDRGSYQSPALEPVEVEPIGAAAINRQAERDANPSPRIAPPSAKLVRAEPTMTSLPQPLHNGPNVQLSTWTEDSVIWDEAPIVHDETCDGCTFCDSGCDSYGCDSIGDCCSNSWWNSSLSFHPSRWFGSIELLMMFRKGDELPVLVTTTTAANPDPDTAGEIGRAGTQVLFGGERVLDELRAGGRLTLGTWIDPCCGRSLVMRGWFAGQEQADFSSDQTRNPVITRPFLNVSDNQAAAQDTQIIAFPDRATGSISVRASSDVFGADVSARQKWFGRFGGTVDVLYGYQYMQLNEDLRISNLSTSQDDDFAPVGSVLGIDDRFDVENEFHGAQFGIASRYREGCWSFHSLIKSGFGSLSRTERLRGETFTSIDGNNATDPNGLLVRSTNARTTTDHTFGWVPELDFTLGWHQYPRFDLTFGYNIIAMTDAIQVSGLMDPDAGVNLSEPPTGRQSPSIRSRPRTFYVQGIHFGLQYVY